VASSPNVGLKHRRWEQKTMDRPYYILLADNHAGFRREVRKILEEIPGVKVTGEASNRRELFELLWQSPPKLVILDISLPDLRAREGTQFIKVHYPETQVLITVLDQESEYLHHGLAVGAAGVLQKQHVGGQIAVAINAVRQGKIYLPPQAPGKNSPSQAAPMSTGPCRAGGNNC
jgi:two-component system invasion response regulator UvrY